MDGSFQCTCKPGFTGDGKTCDGRFKCLLFADVAHFALFLSSHSTTLVVKITVEMISAAMVRYCIVRGCTLDGSDIVLNFPGSHIQEK